MTHLKEVFARHAVDNQVELIYETRVCYGRLR